MRKKDGIRFTREALYELVWTKPMTEIAVDFGMSSNAFAKHCRRLDVPIPWRGYWQRIEHGHPEKRPALPKAGPNVPRSIEIVKHEPREPLPAVPVPDVTITDRLVHPHPVLVQLRELLRRSDGKEGTVLSGSGHAVFSVSASSKARAFRVLDATLKAFDAIGATTKLSSSERGNRHALEIELPDRPPVELWLTEHLRRTPHVLNDFDKSWGLNFARKYDYEHSGVLIIEIAAPYTPHGLRRRWADSKRIPLERKVSDVVVGVHRAADALQAQNERWERQRQEEEERRQREADAERRRKIHDALAADVRDMAARWREAEGVRAFLAALNAALPTDGRSREVIAWLEWAEQYVRDLDPLARPGDVPKRIDA